MHNCSSNTQRLDTRRVCAKRALWQLLHQRCFKQHAACNHQRDIRNCKFHHRVRLSADNIWHRKPALFYRVYRKHNISKDRTHEYQYQPGVYWHRRIWRVPFFRGCWPPTIDASPDTCSNQKAPTPSAGAFAAVAKPSAPRVDLLVGRTAELKRRSCGTCRCRGRQHCMGLDLRPIGSWQLYFSANSS